jgi:DNA repair protein REV1
LIFHIFYFFVYFNLKLVSILPLKKKLKKKTNRKQREKYFFNFTFLIQNKCVIMKRNLKLEENLFDKEFGGYMNAKITKLEEQFSSLQKDFQKTELFKGVSIFVNGRTNPTADELKRIMLENGGTYHHYERSHTRFVVASNLPDVKIRNHNLTKNIIRPEWIVDCVKANKLVDYSSYLLHTNKNSAQPQISFKPLQVEKTEEEKFAIDLSMLNNLIQNKKEPEGVRTGTAVDANFLEEFLNNSRLHHIATLGSGFKFYITELRKKHDGTFPHRESLRNELKASSKIYNDVIMHIDMDCFFVSVSLKKHPHLKGHPIAVTHSKGSRDNVNPEEFKSMSEIASCSYEARAKGLRNGMFVGQALKLCPELKTVPYEFEEYRKTAFILYDTVAKYTLDIEAVSCDEMYANLKDLLNDCEIDVMDFITHLRSEIFELTGCTCSVGIGANRLQARLATKKAKPNGQFELLSMEANIQDFMKDIKITELPGEIIIISWCFNNKIILFKALATVHHMFSPSCKSARAETYMKCLYQCCRLTLARNSAKLCIRWREVWTIRN